jgi:membrane fusion protein, multidrug efflux system
VQIMGARMIIANSSLSAIMVGCLFAGLLAPSAAQAQAAPPAVLVQPAALRVLTPQSEFIGRVKALDKVDLRARVAGFLGPRQFKDGEHVREGEVLFQIERAPFEAAVEQRQAQVASAEATLVQATQQLQRAQVLIKNQTVSQATLDDRTAEEARARAAVLEARAALRDAEIRLSYTEIKSPMAGRIGRAVVSPGNLVGPDTGVLATVVQDDSVEVLFPVTQREMLEAKRVGGTAEALLARARLADGSLYDQEGKINFVDVQVDPRTDGQIVRALFPNPKSTLVEGQTVRIVIEEKDSTKVVVIPHSAVAVDQTGPYVFVVGKDDRVELRRVRLGTVREGLVVVEEGIAAGDLVVVQGQQRIRAGMTVAPQVVTSITPEGAR